MLLIFGVAYGQTPISLQNAYERAIQNNLDIRSGQLRIDYQDKIKNSYATIDPLNVTAEVGQINSAYTDNKISASQTFRLAKFYSSQKLVLQEEWKNAQLSLELQKRLLKRDIALIYNNLNYFDEKKKLIVKTDSIYSNYYKRADLRLKKGESNILEKTTAETYRSQAEIQLQNLTHDRNIALAQLNYTISDGQNYVNDSSGFYNLQPENLSENYNGSAIVLQQLEQQKNIENARLQAEKSKLLPSFSIGMNSGTIKGMGADEKMYSGTHRFQSGLAGIAIPIFNNAQKAVIEGQKVNQQIAENNYEIGSRNLKNQYAKALGEYEKLKAETEYYTATGLKNAEKIMFTANLLLKEGEINYLEYTFLVNQSLDIQNKYIEARKQLNEKIIELNFLRN